MSDTVLATAADYERIARYLHRKWGRSNLDDAEEAVQQAVERLLRREQPLDPAYVFNEAGAILRDMMARRERGNDSLDAWAEHSEDQAPHELAVDEVDFEAHAQLREARDNVILRRRLEASEIGAPELRRRGAAATTRGRVFSDEKVAEVRQLRREGLIYRDISAATGVPESTCVRWCLGQFRKAPTSNPGWTRELVIEAIAAVMAEDGLHPPSTQMGHDPRLPTAKCFYPFFESWPEAVQLAVQHASKSSAPPPPVICV